MIHGTTGWRSILLFLLAIAVVFPILALAATTEPDAGWLAQARQQIEQAEYEITSQAESWQAPNRAQGFRTHFTGGAIRVEPRTEATPAWSWGLQLTRWGRPGALAAIESALPRAAANRIEYPHTGLTEWYVNAARGLEQGFTLAAPPHATDPPQQVHIELALSGTLRPIVSTDGQAIDFATPAGVRAIRYAQLVVTDATGRTLPSRMQLAERTIRLVFEDDDAVYPVTVDPLATSAAWTVESDSAGAELGWSVATAGDVNGDGYSDVIVGAQRYNFDHGRAYVYHGSSAGLPTIASWIGEGAALGVWLGASVATAGDVNGDGYSDVIIGATGYTNPEVGEGQALVYLGSAAGLASTPVWTAESDQADAFFGWSVGTAGDVNGDGYSDVVVGARYYDNGEDLEGRAYVYLGSATGLASSPAWTGEGDEPGAFYGWSVGTAGDVNQDTYADVIVGAVRDADVNGRAFVYYGSAAGLASSAAWVVQGGTSGGQFGAAVGTAGDVNGDNYSDVIVGANWYHSPEGNEGAAFVYHGSAAGLSTTPAWTAETNQPGAQLGAAAGTAGDVNGDGYADVIVGAWSYDNDQPDEGHARVYFGSAAGLSTTPAWAAEGNQSGSRFGWTVATAGDVNGDGYSDVIAGAPFYQNGETNEGKAWVYLGSPGGPATSPGWTAIGDQANGQLASAATSAASAGDVNGDGYADVILGAFGYDNGQTDEGRAFVYLGTTIGLSTTPAWTAECDDPGAEFGQSVGTAGDVNGDGYSDVIVGAHLYDNGEQDEGAAFVYLGSIAGLASSPAWSVEGDQAIARLGQSVGTAGDVNGDGLGDVIVGVHTYDGPSVNEGRVLVYHGSAAGLPTNASWLAETNEAGSFLGSSVGTAGDVNGDGYSDVIVGAPGHENDRSEEGLAYVYHGSASGLGTTPAWTGELDEVNAFFGTLVGTAGDVNGDGYSDVIVAAYRHGPGDEGGAWVYTGSATGLGTTPAWSAEGERPIDQFGWSAATAGDVNGDGYSDVVVGAHLYENGHPNEGRAYVYLGSAAGLPTVASWTAEPDRMSALFGESVASAGDVNGDGYADLLVGATFFDDGEQDGRAFLYYGNGGRGRGVAPRQLRGSTPIDHLGVSDTIDTFSLQIDGHSPFGRGRATFEFEVKPLGTLFDGTGIDMDPHWHDTGIGGGYETAGLLTPGTPYHWRLRMRYDPVTVPFQQRGPWVGIPRNGWQETDLRTAPLHAAGRIANLRLARLEGGDLALSWDASCSATDIDYTVYEGEIGNFTSHINRLCSTNGQTSTTLTPLPGSRYYLVVPRTVLREGSYGVDSTGDERPPAASACVPQLTQGCP